MRKVHSLLAVRSRRTLLVRKTALAPLDRRALSLYFNMKGVAMTWSMLMRSWGFILSRPCTNALASGDTLARRASSYSPLTICSSVVKGVAPRSIWYIITPSDQRSTLVVNSRLGSSTKVQVKSPSRLPRSWAMAWTPPLVPAPSSLKSFTKGISRMLMPLMVSMAQPSPTPFTSAWPPGSMPWTMAPLPSGRCVTMPKPGEATCGDLKV
mmetsp:Transcript_16795/g.23142  ORF Transcript_16795/g.23142 Transcript_16795/m.23142 type:complete len:210 (+) Transcript_16795:40-669(+)